MGYVRVQSTAMRKIANDCIKKSLTIKIHSMQTGLSAEFVEYQKELDLPLSNMDKIVVKHIVKDICKDKVELIHNMILTELHKFIHKDNLGNWKGRKTYDYDKHNAHGILTVKYAHTSNPETEKTLMEILDK